MILWFIRSGKNGLDGSAWVDEQDYQNKDKTHYHYED